MQTTPTTEACEAAEDRPKRRQHRARVCAPGEAVSPDGPARKKQAWGTGRGDGDRAIRAVLATDRWDSVVDVARAADRTPSLAQRRLVAMERARLVESRKVKVPGGGRKNLWRLLDEGAPPPMYEAVNGMDFRPLAACYNRLTYPDWR